MLVSNTGVLLVIVCHLAGAMPTDKSTAKATKVVRTLADESNAKASDAALHVKPKEMDAHAENADKVSHKMAVPTFGENDCNNSETVSGACRFVIAGCCYYYPRGEYEAKYCPPGTMTPTGIKSECSDCDGYPPYGCMANDTLPPSPPGAAPSCLSATIFDALVSMPGSIAGADDQAVSCALFVFLILFGFGMLFLGACFETIFSIVAFGTVFWLVTFISTFAIMYGDIYADVYELKISDTSDCSWPFWFSLGLTLGVVLALAIISCVCTMFKSLFNFIGGFTIGGLGMVLIFFIIENSYPGWLKDQDDSAGLAVYVAFVIFVAVVCGVIAIFCFPAIGVLTRCGTGGFVFAVGIVGITNTYADKPLAEWVFWVIFGCSTAVGLLLQLWYTKNHPKSEDADETTPLKRR